MALGYPQSKWSVQLVDPSSNLLAELGGKAANRQFTVTRNDTDDIQWSLSIT